MAAPVGRAHTISANRSAAADLGLLERRLRAAIAGEVSADLGTRALFASDASNYRVLPGIVVAPGSSEDLATTLALCHQAGVPVTMRGAGTSVAGNACGPGVLVDVSRHLTRILDIDTEGRTITVEPGLVLDDLNRHVAGLGLRVGPDPSTHSRCTVGGMIGNNACGPRSIRWGSTADNVLGLRLALADGTTMTVGRDEPGGFGRGVAAARLGRDLRSFVDEHVQLLRAELPPWGRRVSGYALDWLLPERGFDVAKALVGTEGTCAVVLSATLRLVAPPVDRVLLVLGFADEIEAARAVPALLEGRPLTLEGMPSDLLAATDTDDLSGLLPSGGAWLFVEADGSSREAAQEHARELAGSIGRRDGANDVRLLDSAVAQARLWRVREEGAGRATRLLDGSAAWPGLEDVAVPPARLATYLSAFRTLLREHAIGGTAYGHFGEGCVHVRLGLGLSEPDGPRRLGSFMREAADLVVAHGGTLSGEHGDGRARSALLDRMFSPAMIDAFRRFKAIWDPAATLNPGVVVDPAPLEQALWPSAPTLIRLETHLAFKADHGDFRSSVERCVGIGKCVSRTGSALMCPSYRATANERDSTRGRARLLQSMTNGDLAQGGWRSKEVREALDLCLACKGCLSECPTGVDMASYKAEFLAHYYRRRLRPASHYSLGWLPVWLRLFWRMPRLVNGLVANRLSGRAFALAAGIAAEQVIPPLPQRPFAVDFRRSRSRTSKPRSVTLWPDTFNNYLTPSVAHSAVRVLEAAGFEVRIPDAPVCCGLTWISTGQLDWAKRILRQTLQVPGLEGDEPVVVLEPSCAAVLRSDLPDLLPRDPRARSLAHRVTTLAEVLDETGFEIAEGDAVHALVQPHCHQQAVLGLDSDRRVMTRNGIDGDMLVGCCGLAGNFGAERGHQAISRAVAALELLPGLARTPANDLVIADGFSCRTQIRSLGGRRALHLAEVLAARLEAGDRGLFAESAPQETG